MVSIVVHCFHRYFSPEREIFVCPLRNIKPTRTNVQTKNMASSSWWIGLLIIIIIGIVVTREHTEMSRAFEFPPGWQIRYKKDIDYLRDCLERSTRLSNGIKEYFLSYTRDIRDLPDDFTFPQYAAVVGEFCGRPGPERRDDLIAAYQSPCGTALMKLIPKC